MRQVERVRDYLMDLQERVCSALEEIDADAQFRRDEIPREGGGVSRPRVLEEGAVCEKAAVNFTHTTGNRMPPAATERRPDLVGGSYEAVSVSLIVHPLNPHAPTCHANYRFFIATPPAESENSEPVWWFGGGFDLTPYYGYEEDVVHWHESARAACAPFGDALHGELKEACDEYFHLPHRNEPRGVGGIFFDDFDRGGFEEAFAFVRSVGDAFLVAYPPILKRRKDLAYGDRERNFQLYRRGRYAEFNLLHDRGTRFGLQAASRTESVLASMPPLAAWRYDWQPEPGSREEELTARFLKPRDWLDSKS
ncbi:MAG: oxygen-dependent coproporphyrinogen oxidase [Myxococcota bacterium]|jgi:coproporphyrinogen III oxidase|nr:oxygen-dependent coproporphyrinogen oxidase [Myxococcota bacterium]